MGKVSNSGSGSDPNTDDYYTVDPNEMDPEVREALGK